MSTQYIMRTPVWGLSQSNFLWLALVLIAACSLASGIKSNEHFGIWGFGLPAQTEPSVIQTLPLNLKSGALDYQSVYKLSNGDPSAPCISVDPTGKATLSACLPENTSQNFKLDTNGDTHRFINISTKRCLYDNADSGVGTFACQDGYADQTWIIGSNVPDVLQPMISSVTGNCLASKNNGISSVACDDTASQKWKLVKQNLKT